MQRLTRGPLIDRLPAGWELWLDGGHNADAGIVIAGMIEEWQAKERKPVSLIFGMLTTKEPLAFLRHLAPHAEDLSAVGIPGDHASLAVADAVGFARQAGLPADGYEFHRCGGGRDHRQARRRAAPGPDLRVALSCRHRAGGQWMTCRPGGLTPP